MILPGLDTAGGEGRIVLIAQNKGDGQLGRQPDVLVVEDHQCQQGAGHGRCQATPQPPHGRQFVGAREAENAASKTRRGPARSPGKQLVLVQFVHKRLQSVWF